MRYRGGAVGHKSTREATRCLFNDRDPSDHATERTEAADLQDGGLPREHEEDINSDEDGEEEEVDDEGDEVDEGEDEEEDDEDRDGGDAEGNNSENEENEDSDSEPASDPGSILDDMEGFGEL